MDSHCFHDSPGAFNLLTQGFGLLFDLKSVGHSLERCISYSKRLTKNPIPHGELLSSNFFPF